MHSVRLGGRSKKTGASGVVVKLPKTMGKKKISEAVFPGKALDGIPSTTGCLQTKTSQRRKGGTDPARFDNAP